MNKIIIFGFPHCGTTILKSIIGHIDEVQEIIPECSFIEEKITKKFAVCKTPFTRGHFFSSPSWKDYHKIFIIRNPFYVFSSLNKRHNFNIDKDHSIENYNETIKMFQYFKYIHKIPNTYLIRYEDIFNNDYQELKNILNCIGLNYTDKIFDNSKYENIVDINYKNITIEKEPDNKEHGKYRTWQVNQPFVNNNTPSKINITYEQSQKLLDNLHVNFIYPNLKNEFRDYLKKIKDNISPDNINE